MTTLRFFLRNFYFIFQDQFGKTSRRKRFDVIDSKVITKKYQEDDFYGRRSDSIVLIENTGWYKDYDLKFAYGVRLQSKMVLTICSAVSYVADGNKSYGLHSRNINT